LKKNTIKLCYLAAGAVDLMVLLYNFMQTSFCVMRYGSLQLVPVCNTIQVKDQEIVAIFVFLPADIPP
jgi:hypothetical protein